ncbi:Organic cation transporter protein [Gryllus bimaculatus]|nr:Organic cation transporter protein [Gryllus bimaculatus]
MRNLSELALATAAAVTVAPTIFAIPSLSAVTSPPSPPGRPRPHSRRRRLRHHRCRCHRPAIIAVTPLPSQPHPHPRPPEATLLGIGCDGRSRTPARRRLPPALSTPPPPVQSAPLRGTISGRSSGQINRRSGDAAAAPPSQSQSVSRQPQEQPLPTPLLKAVPAAAAAVVAMAYDDVLTHLGDFGRYQRRIYLLLCLPAVTCALHKMSGVFLQGRVEHRCRLPSDGANATFALPDEVLNASLPWDEAAGRWSSCLRRDDADPAGRAAVPCRSWVYDPHRTTAVSEWDLVCEHDWLRPTADACVMTGVLVGALLFGALSDRFGRRPVFFGSLVLQVAVGLLAALAPYYVLFLVLRFVIGMTTSGVFLVAYVLAMEMVGPSKRLVAGVSCQLFFTAGYMLSAVFAKYITDWRLLQAAMTAPGLLFLLYWWFANNLTYYGLSWNTANLGGDIYLNFLISGAVEIPAYIFLLLTLNRWGRKAILCGSMIVGAVILLITTLVPQDMTWLTVTLVMVGKLAITASYGTVYVFTTEQFPTVIRNAALGTSSMCARVGGIIAPYINLLGGVWPAMPTLVFGGMTLTAGLMALLLPETLNRTLPDTIADGESFGMKKIDPENADDLPVKKV